VTKDENLFLGCGRGIGIQKRRMVSEGIKVVRSVRSDLLFAVKDRSEFHSRVNYRVQKCAFVQIRTPTSPSNEEENMYHVQKKHIRPQTKRSSRPPTPTPCGPHISSYFNPRSHLHAPLSHDITLRIVLSSILLHAQRHPRRLRERLIHTPISHR
jgi:hypothetical protein